MIRKEVCSSFKCKNKKENKKRYRGGVLKEKLMALLGSKIRRGNHVGSRGNNNCNTLTASAFSRLKVLQQTVETNSSKGIKLDMRREMKRKTNKAAGNQQYKRTRLNIWKQPVRGTESYTCEIKVHPVRFRHFWCDDGDVLLKVELIRTKRDVRVRLTWLFYWHLVQAEGGSWKNTNYSWEKGRAPCFNPKKNHPELIRS